MTCFNRDCHAAGKCVAEPNTGCRASIVLSPPTMTPNTELSDQMRAAMSRIEDGVASQQMSAAYVFTKMRELVNHVLAASPAPLREADERTEFETWARQFKFDLTRCDPSYVNEPYANEATDWAWLAYQTGRVAPSGIEADGDGGKETRTLYELTGDIKDVNTLLVNRAVLRDLAVAYGRACIDWAQADPEDVQAKHDAMKAAHAALLSPTSPPIGKTEGDASRGGEQQ
jgi:hypothetical protein